MFYLNGTRLTNILSRCKDKEHEKEILNIFIKLWCLENVYEPEENKEEALLKVKEAEKWVKEIEELPQRKIRLMCISMAGSLMKAKDIYNWMTEESLNTFEDDWIW